MEYPPPPIVQATPFIQVTFSGLIKVEKIESIWNIFDNCTSISKGKKKVQYNIPLFTLVC